jgi:two-component system phosphate regulon response regulator PhoB/two-component system alkaline phosphatase synthesis response regulator PhoP
MLSARSEGQDKILGLEGGADDYITKPFDLRELFLRIGAAIRQVELLTRPIESRLAVGNLLIDSDRFQASAGEEKIDLTPSEFRILQLLAKHHGTEVRRETINREILGKSPDDAGRTIDVHVRNIRRKLVDKSVTGCSIETVHGTGYKLTGSR